MSANAASASERSVFRLGRTSSAGLTRVSIRFATSVFLSMDRRAKSGDHGSGKRPGGGQHAGRQKAPHQGLPQAAARRKSHAQPTVSADVAAERLIADDLLAGWAELIDIPDQARIDPFAIRDLVGTIRHCIIGASL